MKTITSRQNQVVRTFRELADAPDPNGARLLLDGAHLVSEAQRAGVAFEIVAVAASSLEHETGEGTLARSIAQTGVEVVSVSEPVLRALSPVRTPSGIVAVVTREPTTAAAICAQPHGFVVAAVDVQDPGNLGSLLRSAEAAGATGALVCGLSASPFSWKAARGSMGSVLRLPVAQGLTADEALTQLRTSGMRILGAAPRGGRAPDEATWSGAIALLLGGEGPGLSDRLLALCDERVSIPMSPPVESLSVAAAGAILLYAARRQRA